MSITTSTNSSIIIKLDQKQNNDEIDEDDNYGGTSDDNDENDNNNNNNNYDYHVNDDKQEIFDLKLEMYCYIVGENNPKIDIFLDDDTEKSLQLACDNNQRIVWEFSGLPGCLLKSFDASSLKKLNGHACISVMFIPRNLGRLDLFRSHLSPYIQEQFTNLRGSINGQLFGCFLFYYDTM